MADKPDPTKDPEFQKVVRHFVTNAPKTHDEMLADKHNPDSKPSARSEKRGRSSKTRAPSV